MIYTEARHPHVSPLRLRQAVFVLLVLLCLTSWMSPPVALALGIVLVLTVENPFPAVSKQVSKWLLQVCVVALGFGMNLSVVLEAGRSGFVFAAGSIFFTLVLGAFLGRLLRIHGTTSALISSGTAICGGSAIAAVGSVIAATEGEITIAMGTVFLLNAVALYLFPVIGHLLDLSQTQFGIWAGIAIHDISSVVGAAGHYGPVALETATAVKLSRSLWIVVVCLFFARLRPVPHVTGKGWCEMPGREHKQPGFKIPYFIAFFLMASIARSFLPGVAAIAPAISHLAATGLTLTLFLIGAGISKATLKTVGWAPLLQGILLWGAISLGSLLVILRTVR